jgi:hypothetical protein
MGSEDSKGTHRRGGMLQSIHALSKSNWGLMVQPSCSPVARVSLSSHGVALTGFVRVPRFRDLEWDGRADSPRGFQAPHTKHAVPRWWKPGPPLPCGPTKAVQKVPLGLERWLASLGRRRSPRPLRLPGPDAQRPHPWDPTLPRHLHELLHRGLGCRVLDKQKVTICA